MRKALRGCSSSNIIIVVIVKNVNFLPIPFHCFLHRTAAIGTFLRDRGWAIDKKWSRQDSAAVASMPVGCGSMWSSTSTNFLCILPQLPIHLLRRRSFLSLCMAFMALVVWLRPSNNNNNIINIKWLGSKNLCIKVDCHFSSVCCCCRCFCWCRETTGAPHQPLLITNSFNHPPATPFLIVFCSVLSSSCAHVVIERPQIRPWLEQW